MPVKYYFIFIIITICSFEVLAQKSNTSLLLFQINRSKDSDVIHYEVNLDENGKIKVKDPISVFWVRHSQGGKQDRLTWIQRNFAYGLEILYVTPEEASFCFVSNPKQVFMLKEDYHNNYKVLTEVDNNIIILESLYVQFNGGSFMQPEIANIIIKGKNRENGEKVMLGMMGL